MATLTGKNISNTYKQLLQVGSGNTGLTGAVRVVQDGSGTASALQLSQSAVNINGNFQLNGTTLTASAAVLNAVADLTGATGIVAVSAGQVYGRTLEGGTGVSITNADGTEGNPTISLAVTGVVSGTYGPATIFEVNAVGQVVSASIAASISVSAVTANTFVGGTFEGSTGNFSSNVSVGGNLILAGQFTPASLSVTGTLNAGAVSATTATFNSIVSAGYFVGDGSGLVNVPSSEGGTIKTLTAGSGITLLQDSIPSDITVSGTVQLNANISVSTVYANTNVFIEGSPVLTSADLSTLTDAVTSINTVLTSVSARTSVNAAAITSINSVVANVSALTSTNAAAITSINSAVANVSALTSTNAAAITSINSVVADVSALTSTNAAAITSINSVVANVSALTSTNAAAITSINSVVANVSALTSTNAAAITSINSVVANVSVLTSTNAAAITSINSVVANVSALTSTNAAAITSINSVVANVSVLTSTNAAAITSINSAVANVSALTSTNAAAITSINSVVANVSALTSTNAAAITSINSVVANVSTLTSVNSAAVTSINAVISNVSALTSVNAAAITSINAIIEGSVSADSGTFNTLRVVTSASIGGTLNVGGNVGLGTTSSAKQLHVTKSAVADIVSLTDGVSISVDFNAGQNFAVQLAGNRTLENPSNCVAGQVGSIIIVQDGTGSRTLSYASSWKFPGGTAPTLSTAISAVDRVDYIVYTSTAVQALATLDVK
jgi:hypothetical protein